MKYLKAGNVVAAILIVANLLFGSSQAIAGEIRVVEFYNTTLNHYFITAENSEAAGIDSGSAGAGWVRTGVSFRAYDTPEPGTNPVCRFYGNPALDSSGHRLGPNSHFYTVNPEECAAVKNDSGWVYESIVFYAIPPTNQQCPSNYSSVKRLYNSRYAQNDSNHRYTISDRDFNAMATGGWSAEGVVLCSQTEQTSSATIVFNPNLLIWTGEQVQHIVSMTDTQIVLDGPTQLVAGNVFTLFDRSFKVTGVTSTSGQTTITFTNPAIEDVFTSFDITGEIDFTQLRPIAALATLSKSVSVASANGAHVLAATQTNGGTLAAYIDPISGRAGTKGTITRVLGDLVVTGEFKVMFDVAHKPQYRFTFRSGSGLTGSSAISGVVSVKGKIKSGGSLLDSTVTVPLGALRVPLPATLGALVLEVPLDVDFVTKVSLAGEIEASAESTFGGVISGSSETAQGSGSSVGTGMTLSDPTTDLTLTAAASSLTTTLTAKSGVYLAGMVGGRVLGLRVAPAIEYVITGAFGSPTCFTASSNLKGSAALVSYIPGLTYDKDFLTMSSNIGQSKKCLSSIQLSISPASPSVNIGSTVTLSAKATDSSNNPTTTPGGLTWNSSTPSIATVSSAGVVTGVAAGTSTITVTDPASTKTASAVVTVTACPSGPAMLVPSHMVATNSCAGLLSPTDVSTYFCQVTNLLISCVGSGCDQTFTITRTERGVNGPSELGSCFGETSQKGANYSFTYYQKGYAVAGGGYGLVTGGISWYKWKDATPSSTGSLITCGHQTSSEVDFKITSCEGVSQTFYFSGMQ